MVWFPTFFQLVLHHWQVRHVIQSIVRVWVNWSFQGPYKNFWGMLKRKWMCPFVFFFNPSPKTTEGYCLSFGKWNREKLNLFADMLLRTLAVMSWLTLWYLPNTFFACRWTPQNKRSLLHVHRWQLTVTHSVMQIRRNIPFSPYELKKKEKKTATQTLESKWQTNSYNFYHNFS